MKDSRSFFVPSSKKLTPAKFFKAAAKGDTTLLRKYAKSHSVNEKDSLGRTALHMAAINSQERSFRTLLALGVDPQASDSQNWTALHAACSVGNTEIVDLLLDTFEERHCLANRINQRDLVECTPLHLACISGNCSVVRSLVRKGAQISAKDATGRTPLLICIEKKNEELIDTIKQTTEEYSITSEQTLKSLTEAVRKDDLQSVVKALVGGVDINCTSEDHQSLLYTATGVGSIDIVKCLIGKGADINQTNRYSRSIIQQCVLEGRMEMFNLFLSLPNLDINNKDIFGRTVLHTAAEWGRITMLQEILNKFKSLDLEQKDELGYTPLHIATLGSKRAMVETLVNTFKVNIDPLDKLGRSPLHYAAQWRRIPIANTLCNAGANVNLPDLDGNTPLHLCIEIKNAPIIKLLLDAKADPCIQNKNKDTTLHLLTKWKRPKDISLKDGVLIDEKKKELPLYTREITHHIESCRLLSQAMAKVNPTTLNLADKEGKSPLHCAITNRHGEVAVELIKDGADTNLPDSAQVTPLNVCNQPLYPRKIRQMLLDAVEARDKGTTETPANVARKFWKLVRANDVAGLKKFVKSKNISIPTQVTKTGQTALHVAADLGLVEMCTFLIAELPKIYIHKLDQEGKSALHSAARNDHKAVCTLLIQAGADVGARDVLSKTPRHMASSPDLLALLAKAKRELQTKELFAALEQCDVDTATSLISTGASLDALDEYNCSVLTVACINGLHQLIDLMIEKGVDIKSVDDNYQSALHWAAMKGHLECVQKLVAANADINGVDSLGNTPLHWAVSKQFPDVAVFLVKSSASITLKDADGKTALDLADEALADTLVDYANRLQTGPRGIQEINEDLFNVLNDSEDDLNRVIELLEEGAEIEALDEHQSTPLAVASISGHYQISNLFIQRGANVLAVDEGGQTPLHWAAIKGNCSVGQLLIDHKANVNLPDSMGQIPLHWAVLKSHAEFCKMLLMSNADINFKDYENSSPADIARGEISELLQTFNNRCASPRVPHTEVEQVVKSTVRDMIHDAVESSISDGNVEQSEQAIMAVVDNILNQVQQKAETVIDKVVETAFAVSEQKS